MPAKLTGSVGLVCSGAVSRTVLVRLPGLQQSLGPVFAESLRAASRAANNLRAGAPVPTLSDLASAKLVLISVPDERIQSVAADLAQAGFSWESKSAVLVNSAADTSTLTPLSENGASIGSFHSIDFANTPSFAIEGDPAALRAMRTLLEHGVTRILEINRGAKPDYLKALDLAFSELVPLMRSTVETLLAAGLDSREAPQLLESLIDRAVRDYLKARRAGRG